MIVRINQPLPISYLGSISSVRPAIAGSSNGRIADFDSVHTGSNPVPASIFFFIL